jgi:hypothetical protein
MRTWCPPTSPARSDARGTRRRSWAWQAPVTARPRRARSTRNRPPPATSPTSPPPATWPTATRAHATTPRVPFTQPPRSRSAPGNPQADRAGSINAHRASDRSLGTHVESSQLINMRAVGKPDRPSQTKISFPLNVPFATLGLVRCEAECADDSCHLDRMLHPNGCSAA